MTAITVVVIIGAAIGILHLLERLARSQKADTLHGRVSDAWLHEHIRGRRDI
jgi:hypothetical protein